MYIIPADTPPTPTFFALQGNSRLQIVHLHLQALQGEVVLARLALVGDKYEDDDDEEEASAGSDAHDGRKRQQAVGHDVDGSRRDVETAHLDLGTVGKEKESGEGSEVDAEPLKAHSERTSRGF